MNYWIYHRILLVPKEERKKKENVTAAQTWLKHPPGKLAG